MYTPLRPQSTSHSGTPSFSSHRQTRSCSVHTVVDVSHTSAHDGRPSSDARGISCKDSQSNANGEWSQYLDLEHLDFSGLDNFEIVTNQYREQGVQFKNAIALHPSNPAFPTRTSQTILLGGPKNGTIELVFPTPVHMVEGYVTGAGVTTLTAFDHQGEIIGTDETLGRNLADDQSKYEPNTRIAIQSPRASAIHCVRLRCGGGQLALADLSFSRISG